MTPLNRANKGLSSVFGSMLFIILIAMVVSALFVGLYRYDEVAKQSLVNGEVRSQESIVIDAMENDSQTFYLTAIHVNNTGAITSQIRAVYLDSNLLLQPSIDLNAKQGAWIQMPANTPIKIESTILVSTATGIKTMAREGDFVGIKPRRSNQEGYFGPLELQFESFSYGVYDAGGNLVPPGWKPGWNVPTHTQNLVWQITLKDTDERAITLNSYSCLTLLPNKQGAQIPWYIDKIEHPENPGSTSFTILSQETVKITYRWSSSHNTESSPSAVGQYRVFLTLFGNFQELDGTIKPYGQSIPFQAVLIT